MSANTPTMRGFVRSKKREEKMIDTEHILVFFESRTGTGDWRPVERENIPDWLRDQDVIERLIAGEKALNPEDKEPKYFSAIQVERPRPIGYRDAKRQQLAAANHKTQSGIHLLS